MKNKTKKQKSKVFLVILLMGLFFGGFVSVNNVKADSNCICSSGSAIPGVYNKDAEYNVADSDSCKQSCMGVNNAKYYSFSDVANIGFRRIYNCLCVNGSLIPFYYPTDSKFNTDGDDACNQQCANQGTKYYSYSNLANLGTSKVSKTPTSQNKPSETITTTVQPKKFEYTLLESFPGFFQGGKEMTDLPTMILAIYKFGIWTVGIAGLFMLVVGGFMYMASAGNTSTASSARGIITDSLIGIIAAMGAYLILYVINPDLTKIKVDFTPVEVVETLGFGEGGGNCSVPTTGPCTVEALQKTCFGSNAKNAAIVCGYESGGNVGSPSKSDKGADKNVFSWGLFQINLTQHSLGGFDCQKAFEGENYASKVINPALYANCKTAATTAMTNINYACKISNNGTNWGPWKNTKKACGL